MSGRAAEAAQQEASTLPAQNVAAEQCDLIIVGSGAAGLTAAVTAAWLGLDVVVLEKDTQIGGTSAWSGGWMWIPRNPLARAAGILEPIEAPLLYLKAELGTQYDEQKLRHFLEQGPAMVEFLQKNTALSFIDGNLIPDFHGNSEGAGTGGRSVCAAPYDGRALGKRIHDLKPPLDEVSPFGMGIGFGADLRQFLNATRKREAFFYAAKRMAKHLFQRLLYGRGMHLVNGNALIARLLKSADDLGVKIITHAAVIELIRDDARVTGVRTANGLTISAKRGVVLAAGGFPHDKVRKAALFPHAPHGFEHHSAAPLSNTGDGLRLGESVGGQVAGSKTGALAHSGAWAPVSLVPHKDGTIGRFPHLVERAKPGLIMVLSNGKRFTNEANPYHDVMNDYFAATKDQPQACWMICDDQFQRRYGLGRAWPWPFPKVNLLLNGYLKRAHSIEALAKICEIDSTAFCATIRDYNIHAKEGRDLEFHRGESPYNRIQGDAEHQPNPCVAPIVHAPFYAVKVVAGSLGTFAGLSTSLSAEVLDESGTPIAGLYAVGNDMASVMGGHYPAGGITLGPGMTFAYIAAHHASGVPLQNNHSLI